MSFAALNKSCIRTFGQPVSYQPSAAEEPVAIQGIVMRDTAEQRHSDGCYIRLFMALADLASEPEHGDEATVDGATYTVFEVEKDAGGGAWLSLREK